MTEQPSGTGNRPVSQDKTLAELKKMSDQLEKISLDLGELAARLKILRRYFFAVGFVLGSIIGFGYNL